MPFKSCQLFLAQATVPSVALNGWEEKKDGKCTELGLTGTSPFYLCRKETEKSVKHLSDQIHTSQFGDCH